MIPEKKEGIPNWLSKALKVFDLDGKRDGDILSHDWIKYALDIPSATTLDEADTIQWMTLTRVEQFKDYMLTERKIAVQSVRGRGYLIVPPSDQAYYGATEAMRLVKKGLDKGGKILNHTRLDQLDTDERRRHTDAQIRISGIGDMMRRQRKDVLSLISDKS